MIMILMLSCPAISGKPSVPLHFVEQRNFRWCKLSSALCNNVGDRPTTSAMHCPVCVAPGIRSSKYQNGSFPTSSGIASTVVCDGDSLGSCGARSEIYGISPRIHGNQSRIAMKHMIWTPWTPWTLMGHRQWTRVPSKHPWEPGFADTSLTANATMWPWIDIQPSLCQSESDA